MSLRVCLGLLLTAGPLLSQPLDRLTGHWNGAIQLPGEALSFDVDFRLLDGLRIGDISSPRQNIRDLAISTIVSRDDSVWFTVSSIPGVPSFAGALSGDGRAIAGTLSQHGGSFPFSLRRAAAEVAEQGPPPVPPMAWRGLIGEYGSDTVTRVMILERDGSLIARFDSAHYRTLKASGTGFSMDRGPRGEAVRFRLGPRGRALAIVLGDSVVPRRAIGPEDGSVFRVVPLKPVAVLRRAALVAAPPVEPGDFLAADLVELVRLDSTIHLDIRYASSRNFLGQPLYTQARAFLQRPAAEALARVQKALRARGYGLLIHDGYRPWYVTKMFWDATPSAQHEFVANPADGSRHNRGAAVDLSLYELRTGHPVEMPGTYDEFSHRSYPTYEGGTSRQRWHRELLRSAMEAEGFSVFTSEWWHFDYKDWKRYRIGNVTFEKIK